MITTTVAVIWLFVQMNTAQGVRVMYATDDKKACQTQAVQWNAAAASAPAAGRPYFDCLPHQQKEFKQVEPYAED